MNRTEEMRKLKKDGYTLTDIAKKFNISRQRVHQIIINNHIEFDKVKKQLRSELSWPQKCRRCNKEIWRAEKTIFHHIDENPNNNDKSNIMILCTSCHPTIHKINKITKGMVNTKKWKEIEWNLLRFKLEGEQYRRFKMLCKARGKSMQEYLEDIIYRELTK